MVNMNQNVLRQPAEWLYRRELEALAAADTATRPDGWQLSPQAVLTYIVGGQAKGVDISAKYIGDRRTVEIAIASLLADRGLLLIGEPGTAKSWLSEHLAAAISGDSTLVVQGTLGTTEEQIRYGWNYALLIANGPTPDALVKTPVYQAMERGAIARFEEISRCAGEVQDALISLLSEKSIAIPELATDVKAARGFNLIATANTRDRGVNAMSSALKRRFNMVVLPPPATAEDEKRIVSTRVAQLSDTLNLGGAQPGDEVVAKVVSVFRELRSGVTEDGRERVKCPSGVLSTADAISLLVGAMSLSCCFGSGSITDNDLAPGLLSAVVKDEQKDAAVLREYLSTVVKKRAGWQGLYQSLTALLPAAER